MRRVAAALAVLGALAAPAAADRTLYETWCARCHGADGDGQGLAARALALNGQPPRDFTAGRFRWKSTPPGTAPTDADLERVIARGVPGTSMPYFEDLLGAEERQRLAGIVRGFARHPRRAGTAIDLGPPLADSPASRARGAELSERLACFACHGSAGAGDGPSAAELRNDDGSRAVPADLTRPWTFRGGSEPADIAMRLAAGIDGTPMPSYLGSVEAADLWAIAHHVRALARAPSLEAAARARAAAPPGAGEPLVRRGEYLTKSGTCFLCHVQMNPDGSYREGSFGAGGMRVEISYTARVFTRNLTPDAETGLGGWSAADLRRALREGRTPAGRALDALDMPWTILAGLTDRDLDAIHAYLATLPPARNLVPPPAAPGLVAAVGGKLRALATGEQIRGSYHPGNAGRPPAAGERPAPVRNPSTDLLVTLGALLVVVVALRRRRRALAAAAALVALVYTWPPLSRMPPALVRGAPPWDGVAARVGLPPLRPPPAPVGITDPADQALARRGQYVATVGTCPLCHTAGPDVLRLWAPFPEMGGGMKVSWKVFGTTYSRNLTPDPETGLGAWSDREVKRAITSGIARDGRLMHWQAMPWDHFSNLAPEDLEALVFYLRHLAPVHSRVPDPEGPRAGDDEGDTFYFGYTGEYRP